MSSLLTKIVHQAVLDANGHQEEFPGEPIEGDWDSESWGSCRRELSLAADECERLWPAYHHVLHTTVSKMIALKG